MTSPPVCMGKMSAAKDRTQPLRHRVWFPPRVKPTDRQQEALERLVATAGNGASDPDAILELDPKALRALAATITGPKVVYVEVELPNQAARFLMGKRRLKDATAFLNRHKDLRVHIVRTARATVNCGGGCLRFSWHAGRGCFKCLYDDAYPFIDEMAFHIDLTGVRL